MSDSDRSSIPRAIPPLRLDSANLLRRSQEVSPTRSSVQSTSNHTPSSSVPNTPILPTRELSPERRPIDPAESTTFLTALAAQERHLLELREEVQKVELELGRLKKQWAAHEATKKKDELRHLQQMQSWTTPQDDPTVSYDRSSVRLIKEQDRRKMMPTNVKHSQRTFFLGSKHTRTLSLLSSRESRCAITAGDERPTRDRRLETVNDIVESPVNHGLRTSTDGVSGFDHLSNGPPQDLIMETGKQIVGDFRQGLWTFFEDLRQVTVGDEAASTKNPRTPRMISASNSSHKHLDRDRAVIMRDVDVKRIDDPVETQAAGQKPGKDDDAFNRNHSGKAESKYASNVLAISSDSDDDDDDGWDDWDTPKTKGAIIQGNAIRSPTVSPLTDMSSAKTSLSSPEAAPRKKKYAVSLEERSEIPWPALAKLNANRLSRTASTLMGDWERSLVHSPADPKVSSNIKKAK